jgi:hypothetical protein
MNEIGTREAKRIRKAMPRAIDKPAPFGCLGSLAVCLAACLALFARTSWPSAIILGGLAGLGLAGIVAWYLYGIILLAIVRLRWTRRGVRCLVVYSESSAWHEHIRTGWLPRIGDAAVVLNLSDRGTWESVLSLRLFRRFCGNWRNFNPAVVVFRGLRQPFVFRFFYAFQQVKAGRRQYLETLESQMFEALETNKAA